MSKVDKKEICREGYSDLQVSSITPINDGVVLSKLKGVFSTSNARSRNGRSYPKELWKELLSQDRVKELLETKTFLGELSHPSIDAEFMSEVQMANASHNITSLEYDDATGDLIGELDILDTPNGRIANTLLRYGSKLGVSSRGLSMEDGSYDTSTMTSNNYWFITFDLVALPGIKSARPNLVLESMAPEVASASGETSLTSLSTMLSKAEKSGDVEALKVLESLMRMTESPVVANEALYDKSFSDNKDLSDANKSKEVAKDVDAEEVVVDDKDTPTKEDIKDVVEDVIDDKVSTDEDNEDVNETVTQSSDVAGAVDTVFMTPTQTTVRMESVQLNRSPRSNLESFSTLMTYDQLVLNPSAHLHEDNVHFSKPVEVIITDDRVVNDSDYNESERATKLLEILSLVAEELVLLSGINSDDRVDIDEFLALSKGSDEDLILPNGACLSNIVESADGVVQFHYQEQSITEEDTSEDNTLLSEYDIVDEQDDQISKGNIDASNDLSIDDHVVIDEDTNEPMDASTDVPNDPKIDEEVVVTNESDTSINEDPNDNINGNTKASNNTDTITSDEAINDTVDDSNTVNTDQDSVVNDTDTVISNVVDGANESDSDANGDGSGGASDDEDESDSPSELIHSPNDDDHDDEDGSHGETVDGDNDSDVNSPRYVVNKKTLESHEGETTHASASESSWDVVAGEFEDEKLRGLELSIHHDDDVSTVEDMTDDGSDDDEEFMRSLEVIAESLGSKKLEDKDEYIAKLESQVASLKSINKTLRSKRANESASLTRSKKLHSVLEADNRRLVLDHANYVDKSSAALLESQRHTSELDRKLVAVTESYTRVAKEGRELRAVNESLTKQVDQLTGELNILTGASLQSLRQSKIARLNESFTKDRVADVTKKSSVLESQSVQSPITTDEDVLRASTAEIGNLIITRGPRK